MTRLLVLLALAGCATTRPTLEQRLDRLAVTDDDFHRTVLYTWTPPDKVDALLVATATSGGYMSPYSKALAETAERDPIAALLVEDPRFARRRYAWPAPFATVMGLGAKTYGTGLIRIELAPEAWIGRFDPTADPPFRFVDAAGAEIAIDDVLAAPERIGAIFHVRDDLPVRFREYVICNDAMIASWSVSAPAIQDELDAEIALLEELRAPFAAMPRHQRFARDGRGLLGAWRRALAFDNLKYVPDPARLDLIIEALRGYDPGR